MGKKNNKSRFRISHSLLNLWMNGKVDEAITTYFHLSSPRSRQMNEGLELHRKWAESIKKDKKLTLGRTNIAFDNPIVEFGENGELIKPYNELWDINGRLDCLDGTTLYEFKSGIKNSLDYAGEYQLPFYFLLAKIAGIPVEKALLVHFNQYTEKTDFVVVWNGKEKIEKARNFIDSIAPEIYHYFLDNGLL